MTSDTPKITDIRARLTAAFEDEAGDAGESDAGDPGASDAGGASITRLHTEFASALRMLEALLFAASEPLDEATIKDRLPTDIDVAQLICELTRQYAGRGVELVAVGGRWQFRTASDLAFLMEKERIEPKKLSRAAIETLAIIAYHQPVTRIEIEQIRGVTVSKGTLDVLLETGWVRLRGRRRTPGRPVCYGTSQAFLEHFGLEAIKDLPGVEELKGAGLLSAKVPPGFAVPSPDDSDDSALDPIGASEDEFIAEGLEEHTGADTPDHSSP